MKKSPSARFDSTLTEPPGRQVCVVTTASVPWRTGTAINPLLRAAYLAHETACKVTLVIPWLSQAEQADIFPDGQTFEKPSDQVQYIHEWVQKRCQFEATFDTVFYAARYDRLFFSISPAQGASIIDAIPMEKRDCAILEEPEHLNWWERSQRWTEAFSHVVGIMHTNYVCYVREEAGNVAAKIIERTTGWLTRIHCHKVIKLSDAIQKLPRSTTMFTHGVAAGFLDVGARLAAQRGHPIEDSKPTSPPSGASGAAGEQAGSAGSPAAERSSQLFNKGAYFIGKAVWGKGYGELLNRMAVQKKKTGKTWHLDSYGHGEDEEAIKERATSLGLDIDWKGAVDHLSNDIEGYRVLVNASLSDVVATTTAEALAMGKWVLVAEHPENEFFSQFANCLVYKNDDEFCELWQKALDNEPPPLTAEDYRRLTWEAATQRLLKAATIKVDEWPTTAAEIADAALWRFYRPFSWTETLTRAVGKHDGGRAAQADLERLAEEDPEQAELIVNEAQQRRRGLRFGLEHVFKGWRLHFGTIVTNQPPRQK